MARKTSKTARASVRAAQGGGTASLNVLGEIKLLIPLNRGRHAYIRNITTGRTPRLATDSEQFVEEIRTLVEAGHGSRIRAELTALAEANPDHGWDATEKRLVEAGIFES
ncbi:MAG TPA: hypothetical protein VKY81_00685 [Natronosporangium sp.]|nr:hypothetical protein [Natronosporangium sp.]